MGIWERIRSGVAEKSEKIGLSFNIKIVYNLNPKCDDKKLLSEYSGECRASSIVPSSFIMTNLVSVQGYRSLGRKGFSPVAEVRSSGCPGTIPAMVGKSSVPDSEDLGPSVAVSQRYVSGLGSESFLYQAKIL